MLDSRTKRKKEGHIFLSNGRVQMKEIYQWRPYFLVEWSCTKERIYERVSYNLVEWPCTNKKQKNQCGPYVLVEWSCTEGKINEKGPYISVECSCAHERNKSMRTLNLGRIVVRKCFFFCGVGTLARRLAQMPWVYLCSKNE